MTETTPPEMTSPEPEKNGAQIPLAPEGNRGLWRSRLGLLGMFGLTLTLILVAFFTDSSDQTTQPPDNESLVALAEGIDARFEIWVLEDGEYRFTLDSLSRGRTAEEVEAEVLLLAEELDITTLRNLSVVRISGRIKVSGIMDADD